MQRGQPPLVVGRGAGERMGIHQETKRLEGKVYQKQGITCINKRGNEETLNLGNYFKCGHGLLYI